MPFVALANSGEVYGLLSGTLPFGGLCHRKAYLRNGMLDTRTQSLASAIPVLSNLSTIASYIGHGN